MKQDLTLVQFDRDVKGPGDPQRCQNTSTFSIGGRYASLVIELDAASRMVTLFDPEAKLRDTVLVPVERVVRMEPAPAKGKATKAA